VFAIVASEHACAVDRSIAHARERGHVLAYSLGFALLSNRMTDDDRDINALRDVFAVDEPVDLGTPVGAVFQDQLELIGVKMPQRVESGDGFIMTLVFRVKKPLGAKWNISVNFQNRDASFRGDHQPIRGLCDTRYWRAGDFVADSFRVRARGKGVTAGKYEVRVGVYHGDGNQRRELPVSTGNADANNRVVVGTIEVH
jgi:hypothetical protein